MTTQTLNLSLETVAALSDYHDEPAWMRAARQAAWAQYAALPLPSAQDEAWRRTPPGRFPLETARIKLAHKPVDDLSELPPCWHQTMAPESQVAGSLVHCDGRLAYRAAQPRLEAQGVVFADLHAALREHSELIRRHWMRGEIARPDFNKFTALHAALWTSGTFVYAPAGARVERPLQTLTAYNGEGGAGLHHTLLIAEAGSRVTLLQDRISQEAGPELNADVVEIYAEAGAWVRYVSLQHWGEQRYAVSVQEAHLQRDANLVWVNAALGSRVSKEFLRSNLTAPGARALMHGFTFAHAGQQLDQSTYQHHQAPETFSDLLYRNVLRDTARTVFYGMIRVEPGAQGTEGYQANHNLLLVPPGVEVKPRAHAIPGLEIWANDVRCSHGATVSRLDPEQLFYLQARGLPRPQAESLIVEGFLRPIVERVPLAKLRERLGEEIGRRFWEKG